MTVTFQPSPEVEGNSVTPAVTPVDRFVKRATVKERLTAEEFAAVQWRAARQNLFPRPKFNVAKDLLAFGALGKARELLQSIPDEPEAAEYLAFLERAEEGERIFARVRAGSEPAQAEREQRVTGVMIAPQPRKLSRLLIIFLGNADGKFLVRPALRNLTDCHLVMVEDPSRCFGLCEIPRVGPDYKTNLGVLKRIGQELGVESAYCMGFSSGGFTALKFGLDLSARRVLCFSSPTSLDIGDEPGSDISKYPQLALLYRKARHLGVSMAKAYRAAPRHPRAILVYGEKHARDAYFARHMEGVPGIELRPIPDYQGHPSFNEAVSRGIFPALYGDLLELRPTD